MSPPDDRHALVIGAGLAGAAVTAALARRGWRVDLFDAAPGPACAASSLPVGMLSPHVTRAPTPLSRLTTLGVARTRAELERLVPVGAGWQPTEVDNHGHDAGRHPAALVRPAALVQAWLAEADARGGLRAHWETPVAGVQAEADGWRLLDGQGRSLAGARQLVVAGALGSVALLAPGLLPLPALPLRPVQGQMSLGPWSGPPLAPRPQRDNGVFVPLYEDSGLPPRWPARLWSMGATYERGASHRDVRDGAHHRNLESLGRLLPEAAEALAPALRSGGWMGWAEVRCASLDRLPLVGLLPDAAAWQALRASRRARPPLPQVPRLSGLHVLAALGSRGLSLAAWCAEALASDMSGDADATPPELRQAIDPARFLWRQSRRAPD